MLDTTGSNDALKRTFPKSRVKGPSPKQTNKEIITDFTLVNQAARRLRQNNC